MYATRLLSDCRKNPNKLTEPPVGALSSGYLVITDEETEAEDTCCWGTCSDTNVRQLPFPQNKIINVTYTTRVGENQTVERDKVWFLPVLDRPLSSNRYYVIRANGKRQGQACTCSKEEDMVTCCFCNVVSDVKPRALDYRDAYQQVEIFKRSGGCSGGGFTAKSIAQDGFPPSFLRRKGWTVNTSRSVEYNLSEAHGLNITVRSQLPQFNFPISSNTASVVVGKWYCPFVFVRELGGLKDQMKKSLFYEMTLEQFWEEIYACENDYNESNVVRVDVQVQKEVNSLHGLEAKRDDEYGVDGIIWYRTVAGGDLSLGLSGAILEKMRSIQELGGWVGGQERNVRIEKADEFRGEKRWSKFGCFVLVERFALRRMDGTLLLTCDFKHTHQIRSYLSNQSAKRERKRKRERGRKNA